MTPENFQQAVLDWFELQGRTDLPWQKSITPYRVWVSEIMLQQTQVATVVDYFNNFIIRFPTLTELANADEGEVLANILLKYRSVTAIACLIIGPCHYAIAS